MADQETKIRVTVEDNTSAGFKQTKRNIEDVTKALEKQLELGESAARALRSRAQQTNRDYPELLRLILKNRDAHQDAADAAQKHGQAAATAASGALPPVKNTTAALQQMAMGWLKVGLSAETARRAFMEYANFDLKLRQMQNSAGATREDIDAIGKTISRVAQTGIGDTGQLSDAFVELKEKANLSLGDAQKIFPNLAQMAAGAGTEVKAFAGVVGDAMRNFKIPVEDVQRTMESASYAAGELNVDFNKLGQSGSRLSEAMAARGYSGADAFARMGVMVGVANKATGDTGKSVQGLTSLLENMDNAATEASLGFEKGGLEKYLKGVADKGEDAVGAFINLVLSSKNQDEVLKTLGQRNIGIVRQLKNDWGVIADKIKEAKTYNEGMAKGKNIYDSPAMAVQRLTNSVNELLRSLAALADAFGISNFITFFSKTMISISNGAQRVLTLINAIKDAIDKGDWNLLRKIFPSGKEFSHKLWGARDWSMGGKLIQPWNEKEGKPYDPYTGPGWTMPEEKQVEESEEEKQKKAEEAERAKARPPMRGPYGPGPPPPGAGGGGYYQGPPGQGGFQPAAVYGGSADSRFIPADYRAGGAGMYGNIIRANFGGGGGAATGGGFHDYGAGPPGSRGTGYGGGTAIAPPGSGRRSRPAPGDGVTPPAPGAAAAAAGPGGTASGDYQGARVNQDVLQTRIQQANSEWMKDPKNQQKIFRTLQAEGGGNIGANLEQMSNYAASRNMTLQQVVEARGKRQFYGPLRRFHGDPGSGPMMKHERDAYNSAWTSEKQAAWDKASKEVFSGGSNRINYATDQGTVGDPNYNPAKMTKYGGNMFGIQPGTERWVGSQRGKPQVAGPVTVPDGTTVATGARVPRAAVAGDDSDLPERVQAVGGKDPEAFITHHTGGRGDVAGVQNTLRQRGLGVQYVMDREGKIHRTGGPGAAHMRPSWGPEGGGGTKNAPGGRFTNKNVVGMEIIAKSDKDVTPQQAAAYARFMARRYPGVPIYGHGQVNPGHKEVDEGQTAKRAAEAYREPAAVVADEPKGEGALQQQSREPTAEAPKAVEQRVDLKVNDTEVQFARSSMRRSADKEVREARWNSYSDIGAA